MRRRGNQRLQKTTEAIPCRLDFIVGWSFLKIVKEFIINIICRARDEAKLKSLKHLNKCLTINQFNGRYTVTTSFLFCLKSKSSCSYDNPLISPPHHCAPEVSNLRRCYRALMREKINGD